MLGSNMLDTQHNNTNKTKQSRKKKQSRFDDIIALRGGGNRACEGKQRSTCMYFIFGTAVRQGFGSR